MKALGTFITMFLLTNEAVQAIEQQDLTLTKDTIAAQDTMPADTLKQFSAVDTIRQKKAVETIKVSLYSENQSGSEKLPILFV